LIWNFTVNAAIVSRLTARGDDNTLSTSLALDIVTDIAVLALFLLLRWLMTKKGWGHRRVLTDLREIGAYVLAQIIGFILLIFVMTPVLGSLYRSGVQDLVVASFALNVVTILIVLPIFLLLRRAMTANGGQASRGGAAGFGFGLAFIAWVLAALIIGNDQRTSAGMSVSSLLPWLFDVCVAASLAAWAGGSAAYALTRFQQSRLWRTALLTIAVPCLAIPAVTVLTMVMFVMACAGEMGVSWSLRAGAESVALAIFTGRAGFGVPYVLATLLWSFHYLRLSR
jgi:hypothetical protein